jgi:hypothetical protein
LEDIVIFVLVEAIYNGEIACHMAVAGELTTHGTWEGGIPRNEYSVV